VVLARDPRREHDQLLGADVAGHLRFVRMGPRAAPLHVAGTVTLVHAEAQAECALPPEVRVEQPSTCGNGLVEPAEGCDDENGRDGDGCTACRVDTAGCVPGEAGVVSFWDCAGEPSDCGLRRCAVGEDCPPAVDRRVLSAGVWLRGASDPFTRVRLTTDVGGLDCACRGEAPEPVCEGACRVEVPACTPVTLAASLPVAGWTGDCAGQGSACVLEGPSGFANVGAVVDLGAAHVGAAFLVGAGVPWDDRLQALPIAVSADGDVALAAPWVEDAGLPGVAAADDLRARRLLAVLDADGTPRFATDFGLADRLDVQSLAFDGDDVLLAGAAGDLRIHAGPEVPRPEDYPTAFVERRAPTGERVWRRPLDVYWGPHAAVVPLPGGDVAAAFAASRPVDNGWGGLTATLVRLDADGEEHWRWATRDDRAWLAMQSLAVATNGRLVAAGMLAGGVDPAPEPLASPATDAQARAAFSIAFEDGGTPTGSGVYRVDDSARGHVRVTPGGAVTALLWAPGRDLRVFRTPDAGHRLWIAVAARASACLDGRFEAIPHLAVDPASDAVAVATPTCAPDGLAVHLYDAEGRWLRTWRFGAPEAGTIRFGGMAFGPDGDLRLAAQVHGVVVVGDTTLESEGWTPAVVTLLAAH
jgi:cysteine-rich repeat protein